jgi:hypothetical protein
MHLRDTLLQICDIKSETALRGWPWRNKEEGHAVDIRVNETCQEDDALVSGASTVFFPG